MKNLIIACCVIMSFSLSAFAESLYDFQVTQPSGEELNLKDYKGKIILVVNIATKCGYTGQLDGLEKLYQKYKKKGLVIVGIPSNDFGGQTPEGNKEVAKFCRLEYGVSFPLTQKLKVKGSEKHPLIKSILSKSDNEEIKWNFTKFLFDKNAKFNARFESAVQPLDSELEKAIQKLVN
ncbi:MAG: glutathione peroxidase [Halobacteriovoraceae bacterium]|nr:glutathione peroxidase [Halobacteriovoraceae bacterium]|tara:strand:- start:11166 stop:11699 length:534 start_codon:yes stop_codon:yes gene_type:complete